MGYSDYLVCKPLPEFAVGLATVVIDRFKLKEDTSLPLAKTAERVWPAGILTSAVLLGVLFKP